MVSKSIKQELLLSTLKYLYIYKFVLNQAAYVGGKLDRITAHLRSENFLYDNVWNYVAQCQQCNIMKVVGFMIKDENITLHWFFTFLFS